MKLLKHIAAMTLALDVGATALADAYTTESRLWPGGVVPYVYADDFIQENVVPVEAAMAVWEAATNVTFVPRTNQADYVVIRNAGEGNGSSSPYIGREGGGQTLYIRDLIYTWTPTAYTYGLAHEWGHVLGLHHTHQRADRNGFVTIYNSRIVEGREGNFSLVSSALGYPRGRMDYDSVMSYGQCIFSTCDDCGADAENCRVIEINDPADAATWQVPMGQRDHLSEFDVWTVLFMYPLANWRFLELNYPGSSQSGTFHNPYQTFANAAELAPDNIVLWMQPATYEQPAAAITTRMLLRAPHGGVLIR